MLLREPYQELLVNNESKGLERIKACRAGDGSYAMVYTPKGEGFQVDVSKISGKNLNWYWFSPRSGEVKGKGKIKNKGQTQSFDPPSKGDSFSGNDWVLVLDDAKYGYSLK
ncbi:putative collagen-binding domain-containing protein [Pleomorphovibrio marinus]|uniref:putative collagen-binding domain-containing protein n=1 Tax=Pleomorphovibrio marinus TaxID=2164132 RepID=UPI000E0C701C|nr:putative collagen-binding domain-containing protein [Pleomorphovibrio marinus]